MPVIRGEVRNICMYEEEGRTDLFLACSKIAWFLISILIPFSAFRFLNDCFGLLIATAGLMLLLLLVRILGPQNLVMIDELICRVVPTARSALRLGRVRVYDFRLNDNKNKNIGCIMRGDLIGGIPIAGDAIALSGSYRGGTFYAKSGFNESTSSRIEVRSNFSGMILLGTLALVVFLCLYLSGKFDAWIYPTIEQLLTY